MAMGWRRWNIPKVWYLNGLAASNSLVNRRFDDSDMMFPEFRNDRVVHP